MKFCPHCSRYFRDSMSVCPDDGTPLDDVAPVFTFQPFEGGRKKRPASNFAKRAPAADSRAIEHTRQGGSPPPSSPPEPTMSKAGDSPHARFDHADVPHYPYVSDPVPPHDDWETWEAEPSDSLRLVSDDGADVPRKALHETTPTRTRETLKSQLFELAAAAFGFGMLGFLLHLVGMSTVKPIHPVTVATVRPDSGQSADVPSIPPELAPTVPISTVTSVPPPGTLGNTSAPVKPSEPAQSSAVAPTVSDESHDSAVARGSTPLTRRPARVRGVPLSTASHRQVAAAEVAPAKAIRAPRNPARDVRVAHSSSPKTRAEAVAKRGAPAKLARATERRPATKWQVASRRRSASPVRIRLARSFEERRSSTQASHPRGEFAPVQVASLPPDALRRRSPASTNDPDEEVIGLSAALSRERARSTSPHGPFGLATGSGDRHVVYVVDASSGMSTHWRRAISEVVESIRSLSSDDTFDIVTFNGRANAFSSTLMPAIPGTEASIIDYLKYVRVAGSANLQDALWVALRLPEVNEVVIVTSGAPTAGETDPRRLARFASSENPGGVRIDTVGVVDADGDRASAGTLLRRIARDSGGDTRLVSID